MDSRRAQRISEAIREELSEMIGYEMADPRLSQAMITDVHLAGDMRQARVMVQVAGSELDRDECLAALEGARHYLKRELTRRLKVYRIPELHFEAAVELKTDRVGRLLKRIRKGRPKDQVPPEKNPAE